MVSLERFILVSYVFMYESLSLFQAKKKNIRNITQGKNRTTKTQKRNTHYRCDSLFLGSSGLNSIQSIRLRQTDKHSNLKLRCEIRCGQTMYAKTAHQDPRQYGKIRKCSSCIETVFFFFLFLKFISIYKYVVSKTQHLHNFVKGTHCFFSFLKRVFGWFSVFYFQF